MTGCTKVQELLHVARVKIRYGRFLKKSNCILQAFIIAEGYNLCIVNFASDLGRRVQYKQHTVPNILHITHHR